MATHLIATVRVELRKPAEPFEHHDDIVAALDMLFQGF